MKATAILTTLSLALSAPVFAAGEADYLTKIMEFMEEIGCEIDPDDIEVEDEGGYDLDDVQCPDGQYDITLDADFNETGRRKE